MIQTAEAMTILKKLDKFEKTIIYLSEDYIQLTSKYIAVLERLEKLERCQDV